MEVTQLEVLETCMQRMAVGDPAYLFTFAREFGPKVESVVRRMLTEMGRRDVLADAGELDQLVQDACWVIYERAAGWRPGGARPWSWAARAIRAELARAIGHRTVPMDDDGGEVPEPVPAPSVDGDAEVTFLSLARRHPRVALLTEAVASVSTPRDQRVVYEYWLQQELGDPSPSHVVAREFGLTPANVRQIDCRMRKRLAQVIASDARFAALEDVRWLAA